MIKFLETHKKPTSLIIKETFLTLNIFFLLTITVSISIYFYMLSKNNAYNYKQVQITLMRKNLESQKQMLQSEILNLTSHQSIKDQIFNNAELIPQKEIKFIETRKKRLEK